MNILATIKRLEQLADWHKRKARSPYHVNDREMHQWAERDILATSRALTVIVEINRLTGQQINQADKAIW